MLVSAPIHWKKEKRCYQSAESPDGFRSASVWAEEVYVPVYTEINALDFFEDLEGWAIAWFLPGWKLNEWVCVSQEIPKELVPTAPEGGFNIGNQTAYFAFISLQLVEEVISQKLGVEKNQALFEKRDRVAKQAAAKREQKRHEKYYSKLVELVGRDPLKEDLSPGWWWDNAPSGATAWLEQQVASLDVEID